jgi:prepilin-type processing-associated H-X9-DG protein
MDITLKYGPPYTPDVTWGYSNHFGGPPQAAKRLDGANTLFGDGHVDWKNVSDITLKLVNYPNSFERWW